ncbi:hypothetical protein [Cohnella mopanensis]|uniref:hypothetical protein n=1 Tax=Cohnella mopanensis TaxID=2911966 RepID=UPI001EF90A87|nr:hypothetical protein [Cohnella mopanensis]
MVQKKFAVDDKKDSTPNVQTNQANNEKDENKEKRKQMFIGVSLMYGGIGIFAISMLKVNINEFLQRYYLAIIGVAIIIYSFYKYLLPIFNLKKERSGPFQKVDIKAQEPKKIYVSGENNVVYFNQHEKNNEGESKQSDFNAYFREMKSLIEHKAKIADEKASILLDKGTNYAKFGIIFFIVSIITWQLLSWKMGGLETQLIYGIASCSFLFLFIEFLSAWFLRQYRHFVDTSTYLIKVKSILDKYMLMVLYAQEDTTIVRTDILNHLAEEIKWPEIGNFSREEMSFAKEAVESASLLIKSIRSNQKETQA